MSGSLPTNRLPSVSLETFETILNFPSNVLLAVREGRLESHSLTSGTLGARSVEDVTDQNKKTYDALLIAMGSRFSGPVIDVAFERAELIRGQGITRDRLRVIFAAADSLTHDGITTGSASTTPGEEDVPASSESAAAAVDIGAITPSGGNIYNFWETEGASYNDIAGFRIHE